MVLRYQTQDICSAKTEISSSQKQTTTAKKRRRHIFCLFFLANIIVWNAAYGLYKAEKGTPIWKTVATDNLIYSLWKKYPLISNPRQKGVVNGILVNEERSAAVIDHKLVHEGDVISGIKIVRISQKKIDFEKNGERWTQAVLERPKAVW